MRPGGFIVSDRSVTETKRVYDDEKNEAEGATDPLGVKRTDIGLMSLPFSKIAYEELGNQLVATLVGVGAFLELTKVLKMESAKEALKLAIRPGRHKFLAISEKALERGAQAVRKGEVQWHNQKAITLWKMPQAARA
ncbi:MAG: hypothetical protein EXR60_00540 [Dehalococcoidia bacterium]|nr:hypothetical protein [Dehalococcoidia bacterium]